MLDPHKNILSVVIIGNIDVVNILISDCDSVYFVFAWLEQLLVSHKCSRK